MITLRENQKEPIEKAISFFKNQIRRPSLIVLPTAWGKSILTAYVARACGGGSKRVTDILQAHKKRRHVIVYLPSVKAAKELANRYPKSAAVYSGQPAKERAAAVEAFKTGKLRVLFNVRVLSVGFDSPNIDCLILAMSTASMALFYQIIGRGTRLCPHKKDCLVIDLGGNVARFGRVEDIRFEKSIKWQMYGTGGRQLSDVPLQQREIRTFSSNKKEDKEWAARIPAVMPFGKHKGEKFTDIPLDYRKWMLKNFTWDWRNKGLHKAVLDSMQAIPQTLPM